MNTFRVKALTLGGEKKREGATSEFAVKCTQSNAPLAVNTAANFNHQRRATAVQITQEEGSIHG